MVKVTNVSGEKLLVDAAGLSGSTFNDAALDAAKFTNIDLKNSIFDDINFTGAKFHNVNLSHVEITNVNLTGMKINGVLIADAIKAFKAT